jgi:hypothetical protein
MIQKFLVQIEDRRSTRWLVDSEGLRRRLAVLTCHIADAVTEGTRPGIAVIREEAPEKADHPLGRHEMGDGASVPSCGAGESVTRGDRRLRELECSKPVAAARPRRTNERRAGCPGFITSQKHSRSCFL